MRSIASRPGTGRSGRRASVVGLAVAMMTTLVPGAAHAAGAVPTFVDGLSQNVFCPIPRNLDSRGEAWVESTVDGDYDGRPDRIHVDFTVPKETATDGLKVPVIVEESPYFAGLDPYDINWPVDHEIGNPPSSKP